MAQMASCLEEHAEEAMRALQWEAAEADAHLAPAMMEVRHLPCCPAVLLQVAQGKSWAVHRGVAELGLVRGEAGGVWATG